MHSLSRVRPGAAAAAAETAATPPAHARGAGGIAAWLRQAIIDGAYRYGDRLPAERRLAATLSSSRATVREALRALEEAGMVSRRVGSGTYVTYRPAAVEADVAEITSPIELIEVRIAIEPHMLRLATVNATPRDIERITEALGRLEAAGADADAFTEGDRAFHQRLADATHNPLMATIYAQINRVRGHAQWAAVKDKILTASRIAHYNRQHRALLDALRARDADLAARLVASHLRDTRRDLLATD